MKKLAAAFIFLLFVVPAWGQCDGQFAAGQVCGNGTATPAPPRPTSLSGMVASGAIKVSVRSSAAAVVTASAVTDYFLCLDPTANAIAVNLPASPPLGLTFLIKDCTGQAVAHNITLVPASGTIDGLSSFIVNLTYQSVAVTYTGAQWSVN